MNRSIFRVLSGLLIFVMLTSAVSPVSIAFGTSLAASSRSSGVPSSSHSIMEARTLSDASQENVAQLQGKNSRQQDSQSVLRQDGGEAVDLVFAMDTSGSMNDEFTALCSKIDEVVTELRSEGITVHHEILGILHTRQCAVDTVANQVPGGAVNHEEDWGPAVHDLSIARPWEPGYVRMVIPMSDEGPNDGDPCSDPGNDRDAIEAAIQAARANQVIASPVLGTWGNPSQGECITRLANDLANDTGGLTFFSTEPASDLAQGIANLIRGATNPDPKGEKEPTALPPFMFRETNPYYGGIQDEAFIWTHQDIGHLPEFKQAYHASKGTSTLPLTIPITRYFGGAEKEVRLVACSWDIDPAETVTLQINGHPLRLRGVDGGYSCRSYNLPSDSLQNGLPSSPGAASNPTDPNANPTPPNPADNTVVVTYSSEYKALIYGLRLVVTAVRPVIMVPGFGSEANDYHWDEVKAQIEDEGVAVIEPCHFVRSINAYFDLRKVFDEETGDNGTYSLSSHPRCFEAVLKLDKDPLGKTGTLAINGRALGATVNEIKQRYGVAQVNLVGHSKGGLFSREYSSGPDGTSKGDIDNLVSISSPHLGAYLMDVAVGNKDLPYCRPAWYPQWLCDLGRGEWEALVKIALELSDFHTFGDSGKEIREKDVNELPDSKSWNSRRQPVPGVTYHSIVATADQDPYGSPGELDAANRGRMGPWPLSLLNDPLGAFSAVYLFQYVAEESPNRGQSDIAILAPSQRIGNIDGYSNREESCQVVRYNHQESKEKQDAGEAVVNALGLNPQFTAGNHCGSITEPVPVPEFNAGALSTAVKATDDTSQALHFSGVITYGVSTEVPFVVDGSHLDATGLWVGDGLLSLELVDPNGMVYTSTVTGTVDTGFAQTGVIVDPLPGVWIARVIAPNTGSATNVIEWDVWISQRSPISFSVSMLADEYPTGSTATIRGYPITGTLPILGASVEAEVRSQSGLLLSLPLLDDGLHNDLDPNDGVYGGELTPTEAGLYAVAALATGSMPSGVGFLRQDYTEFQLLPASASFSGTFADSGIDNDGDGLYEMLQVQVGVNLAQDGEYEVAGTLSSPTGTKLGTVTTVVSGTAGTNHIVNLDFDASFIIDSPSDGQFTLSSLILIDKSVGLRADYLENAYTTQAYSRLSLIHI